MASDKFAKPVKLSVQSTDEIVTALDACNQHVARGREISSHIRHSRHPRKSREHTLIDKSILRAFSINSIFIIIMSNYKTNAEQRQLSLR